VKDHVEDEINHFHRGKSHTSLDKERDVQRLQASYSVAEVHIQQKGRKVNAKEFFVDVEGLGSDPAKLLRTIELWRSNRVAEWSSEEDWTDW
jgi:hypothetical protein